MQSDTGAPRTGWADLVSELLVSDIDQSLSFCETCWVLKSLINDRRSGSLTSRGAMDRRSCSTNAAAYGKPGQWSDPSGEGDVPDLRGEPGAVTPKHRR